MKINWTNRLKNGATLSALIGTLFLLVKQVTEIFGIDISNQLQMASGIVGTILTLLAGLGIITNPNTKGVSDAGIDMQLSKPRDQNKIPVSFEEDNNSKTPKFYDTSQPFTDDSTDVVFDVNQYDANERERGL
ncbi:phage holin [Staphylococcus coagulans]|uniref:phage holin n=1 Tax=Staphylococcus coagulans TaxID=74706 RepID=UPI001BE56F9D|nr:phage holin [Staphylococcus coagulans]MBT2844721.1 phage holin [Staphylococcus coagulans]